MKNTRTKNFLTKSSILTMALIIAGVGATNAMAFNPAKFDNLTDAQKQTIQQARDLKEDGKYEEARELMSGIRDEIKADHFATREAIKEAISNNDYVAFQNIANKPHFGNDITQEVFAKLVEAHGLREAGDMEGAREIMKDLGFEKRHHGKHKGFRNVR